MAATTLARTQPTLSEFSNSIEHMGTFTEKDMNDALDQTANALKMGIGPWCRTMTKMLKATVAE